MINAEAEKLNMQGEREGTWGLISLRTLMTCIPTPPTITRGSIFRFFGWAKPPSPGTLMGRPMAHGRILLSVWVLCGAFSYLSLGMDDTYQVDRMCTHKLRVVQVCVMGLF